MDNEKINKFLASRIPLYIDENARIKIPANKRWSTPLITILQEDGYSWISTTRGYKKDDFVMLYSNDYQIPNCYIYLLSAIFAYFPNVKWIGLGCLIGEPGEIWKPRLTVTRNMHINPYVETVKE